jgi:hypothetical protein
VLKSAETIHALVLYSTSICAVCLSHLRLRSVSNLGVLYSLISSETMRTLGIAEKANSLSSQSVKRVAPDRARMNSSRIHPTTTRTPNTHDPEFA